jgi:hypothetical protein
LLIPAIRLLTQTSDEDSIVSGRLAVALFTAVLASLVGPIMLFVTGLAVFEARRFTAPAGE